MGFEAWDFFAIWIFDFGILCDAQGMRRRRVIVIVAGSAVAVVAVALAFPRDREPEYNGMKLSSWLAIASLGVSAGDSQCAQAVRQIGTNALPFLLKWIRYERSPWQDRLLTRFDKLAPRLRRSAIRAWLSGERQWLRAHAVEWGFYILGADAAPAIPGLVEVLNEPRSPEGLWRARRCLQWVLATTKVPAGSRDAQDAHRAWMGDWDLSEWGRDRPGLVVAGLGTGLRQSRFPGVQCGCAAALGQYGKDARPALPILVYEIDALNEPDRRVREAVTNALRQIAPEVLQAGAGQGRRSLRQEH